MDTIANVAAIVNLIVLGGLGWKIVGWLRSLKGAIDAQKETITAQKESLQGLRAVLDITDYPQMLGRIKAYNEFVDQEKHAWEQRLNRQLDEEKQKSSQVNRQLDEEKQKSSQASLAAMDIIGALMPYVPREVRKNAIETANFDDHFKGILLRLAGQAPDIWLAQAALFRVAASSPTDIQPVLDVIIKTAAYLCDAPSAAIHRVDGDILRRVAVLEQVPTSPIGEEIPFNRDRLPGRAVVDRKTIHVIDRNVPLDMKLPADILKGDGLWGAKTMVATPLLKEGKEAIGCIVIRRFDYCPFTPQQIALLEKFADQAVFAMGERAAVRGD